MSIRIMIYGKQGDAAAFSAQAQVRALVNELRLDASVQMVTDPVQMQMMGLTLEDTPAVAIDSIVVTRGYVPSRMEMQRAVEQRENQLHQPSPSSEETDGLSKARTHRR
jgi:hypothetical protein